MLIQKKEKRKALHLYFSSRSRFHFTATRQRGRRFSYANEKLNVRFAAFIKEKRRERRRLGRLIFSKCLNRFWGGRRMKRLRATQMWISASRRLQSWAAGLLLFFLIFTPLISPFVSFPPFKGSLASALPQKPAGCLISCAAPRPFQSDGLLLCLIQAAVSASSYFAANTGGFFWFCFFFLPFIPSLTKRRTLCLQLEALR